MNPSLIVPRYIWGALLFSQLLYLYILQTMEGNWARLGNLPPAEIETYKTVFAAISVANFIGAFVIYRVLTSRQRARVKAMGRPEISQLMSLYLIPFILTLALFEAVTLFGFVLSMIAYDATLIYPYIAAGSLGMIWLFPTEDRIRKAFE